MSARAEAVPGGSAAEGATAAAVVFLGCVLLMLRLQVLGRPSATPLLAATYAAILGGAILVRVPAGEERPSTAPVVAAALIGVGAVVVAALAAGPSIPVPAAAWAPAINAVAAVGEEALFRRAAFGWLTRLGPVAAVVATAVLFALVHVPVYGTSALPVDLGAGLLFGWQRALSGTWTVPATTHVVANLMTVLR